MAKIKSDKSEIAAAASALVSAIPEEPRPEPLPEGPLVVTEYGSIVTPVAPREVAVMYTPELADRIHDLYVGGMSLHRIARIEGMPAYGTLLRWFKDNQEFRTLIETGRQLRALHHEEAALEAACGVTDPKEVPGARLEFDAHVWAAEVNDPARYGKKTTIGGDPNKPIIFQISTGVPEPTDKKVIELNADGTVKVEDPA